ncbi:radical SAM protein [Azospira inquinata]|uniref:radical SAM protein n=1 Tax=Azospira inquinata TaxID=2785627 RepID=UPI001C0BB928|nr:radical SAM protein [Azospira inquinata]QWT46227.1 radical SAM protein [Azospira inquinata]
MSSALPEHTQLILDGTKIPWHLDRVQAWERGERIAPITIDMALTRACNYACTYCYATLQENDRKTITQQVIYDFLEDAADIGVKGISLVSDGESSVSPVFADAIVRGGELGLSMATGTNGFLVTPDMAERILPHLTYLRINISAGERDRYAEIMGVKPAFYDRVLDNIRAMVRIKRERNLSVTLGLQMVLMPQFGDQVLPLARLGRELGVDYCIFKHCSDNEDGDLQVDYSGYGDLFDTLHQAEALSTPDYQVSVKWSKILAGEKRSYQRCYGPPFIIQLSGSGLVAPCGMLFNERYKKFHLGNICDTRFKDIWQSDAYWEVMNYLASPDFNAQTMCGTLCLQHKVNETLDAYRRGEIQLRAPQGTPPDHLNFI